ncbi:MAG TPA: GNVR domain-containing protein [Candidatus Acidoferrales bacterium]|nr:GNVR domain-containing protein [Candidatus Acidoferrales bacterium]
MSKEKNKPEPEIADQPTAEQIYAQELEDKLARQQLMEKFRLLWLSRSFLFRASLAGLVCTAAIAFLIPKRYVSTARLMPPDSRSSSSLALVSALSGQSGLLGGLAGNLLGIQSTGDLFIGVLRSRTVEDRIINRFDLNRVYGDRLEVSARQDLTENTSISEDRKSGIISVAVTDHDPKRAAAIAGAYIDQLNTMMTQLSTSSAHRERIFLEERLSAVNQDLETAEKNFSQFASKHGTIDITEQGKAMVEAGATLEGQLIAAQSELQGLKEVYTDNNVRVRATEARIAELRRQLEKLSGTAGAPPADNAGATSTDTTYPSLRQLPILGVPFADLYRKLKVEEAVYETLTKEYELAKVEEAKETPTVRVLDPPEVPQRKSYPPRLLLMILGTFLAMSFAMVWVLGRARWQAAPADDPGKQLAREIFASMKARLPGMSSNGAHAAGETRKVVSDDVERRDVDSEGMKR